MTITMRTRASGTAALHVIDLRPRAMARRATVLREQLVARRRRVAPGHQRPLEIVLDVLDRTAWVPAPDLDAWERLLDLVETHDGAHSIPAVSAASNLFGLAVFGDVLDHAALADLAEHLGGTRLARLQHRHGAPLEGHAALPLTSRAIRRMVSASLGARLAADPLTEHRADQIDHASLRAAQALLVQGTDRTWTVPVLDSPEELVDIASHGTVVEWRHHIAMVMADPWSPYTARVVDLAEQAGDSHAAAVIAVVVDLCREQAAEVGLAPLPREIGGLVAVG
ncbi:MAG: hypothetical protein FWE71_12480 [Nocardioidaceae bacterium]|nr:hypothetical protein [Nocardioidaceae bacterium]MCL2613257.1 hypothetical protein [Nocardioidaceae bacterium]